MDFTATRINKATHTLYIIGNTNFAISNFYSNPAFFELQEWDVEMGCYIPYFEGGIFDSYREAMQYLENLMAIIYSL